MKTRSTSEPLWGGLAAFSVWLGFPNDLISLPPAIILWPFALAVMGITARSWQRAFLSTWLATSAGMLCALYWLCMPVAQVGGLPWPLAFLCAILIAAALAAQGGFFGALAFAARNFSIWLLAPLLGFAWYLLELAFALSAGFPWLPLSGALIQWPLLMQTADIFGAYFSGCLWLIAALLCLEPQVLRSGAPLRFLPVASGALLASALLWYGIFQLATSSAPAEAADSAEALIVEGNVDQNQKWTPPFQRKSLDLYLRLTEAGLRAARQAGVQSPLILWPETAMPFFYERNFYLGQELRDAVRTWGTPLLFGAPGVASNGPEDAVFNRAFLLGPGGQTLGQYDKVHLVPFGEYLPSFLQFAFLEALLQGVGIYQEGNSIESLDYGRLALGVLICYEGIFPWLARDRVTGGANILVDISNDGWFGRTPASRQHLYLTALRCLEQNRWLWRATNTGISGVADNRGRIVVAGPMFQEGFMLCQGRLENVRSRFYYFSSWLPWLVLGAFCALLMAGLTGARISGPDSNAAF